jgi:hypothetical protein
MLKFLLVLAFVALGSVESAPGVFDFVKGLVTRDSCDPIPSGSSACAIVYDEERCDHDDWDPIEVQNGVPVSFSRKLLKFLSSSKKDEIESLVVKKGCTLEVFKEDDYSGDKYTFVAPQNQDLLVDDLDDSPAKSFGN